MPVKRLYRSRIDSKLGGVCRGFADYFDVDPVIVRLLAVGAVFLSAGTAILGYIVAWVIIPEEPIENLNPPNTSSGQTQASGDQRTEGGA